MLVVWAEVVGWTAVDGCGAVACLVSLVSPPAAEPQKAFRGGGAWPAHTTSATAAPGGCTSTCPAALPLRTPLAHLLPVAVLQAALAPDDWRLLARPSGMWLVLTVQLKAEQNVTISRKEDGHIVAQVRWGCWSRFGAGGCCEGTLDLELSLLRQMHRWLCVPGALPASMLACLNLPALFLLLLVQGPAASALEVCNGSTAG